MYSKSRKNITNIFKCLQDILFNKFNSKTIFWYNKKTYQPDFSADRSLSIDAINAAYLSGISFVLEDIITGIEGQDYIHLNTLERICIEHYNAYKSGYNKTQGNKSNDVITIR